jgi:Flp pilus assembly protein TadD
LAKASDYSEAIRLDPSMSTVYGRRGYALLAKGDGERARADFEKAKSLRRER